MFIQCNEISIIIPVKDNQLGINGYLAQFFAVTQPEFYPKEIIIVDNNSDIQVEVASRYPVPVHVIECKKPGPAAARNAGIARSSGKWMLFHDSDVKVDEDSVRGFSLKDWPDDTVGIQGRYVAVGDDWYSQFYARFYSANPICAVDHRYLDQPHDMWRPKILVTANCLVLKEALEEIGSFDEGIPIVASEDVEMYIRLEKLGRFIGICHDSLVTHHTEGTLEGFIGRCLRYCRGDAYIREKHPDQPHDIWRMCHVKPEDGPIFVLEPMRLILARTAYLLGPPSECEDK